MTVKNSITNKPKKMTLTTYLSSDAVKNQINNVVGSSNGVKFISSLVSAVQATPALQECTNASLVSAALLGYSLNLAPSPQLGQFYMVPFKQKEKIDRQTGEILVPEMTTAQFILGYKGMIQLAIRSGYYKKLNVLAIKNGEFVSYDPLDEEIMINLIEDDGIREETPTIGYYAMFEYGNGFRKTMYWSKKKMLAHAERYSPAFSRNGGGESLKLLEQGKIPDRDMWKYSSFWFTDFDGMALKTMLRQLISKWGIMSIDLLNAIEKDATTIKEDGLTDYVEMENTPLISTQNAQTTVTEKVVEKPSAEMNPQDVTAAFFS